MSTKPDPENSYPERVEACQIDPAPVPAQPPVEGIGFAPGFQLPGDSRSEFEKMDDRQVLAFVINEAMDQMVYGSPGQRAVHEMTKRFAARCNMETFRVEYLKLSDTMYARREAGSPT